MLERALAVDIDALATDLSKPFLAFLADALGLQLQAIGHLIRAGPILCEHIACLALRTLAC